MIKNNIAYIPYVQKMQASGYPLNTIVSQIANSIRKVRCPACIHIPIHAHPHHCQRRASETSLSRIDAPRAAGAVGVIDVSSYTAIQTGACLVRRGEARYMMQQPKPGVPVGAGVLAWTCQKWRGER